MSESDAEEMPKPFADSFDWERAVKQHSKPLFPAQTWNQRLTVHGQTFVPIIKSLRKDLRS